MLERKNCIINEKNGVLYITFPILTNVGIKHCFSTKKGGVSEGRYAEMNLSYTNGDNPRNVKENFRRICDALEVEPESVVMTHQTHTVNIAKVQKRGELPPDIDGLITDKKGITLCSSYADCVPLIFCDPKRRVIATSHSGWRGTVGEIGRLTIEQMVNDYRCQKEDILAVVGPAICKDCYEVDDTVANKIKELKYLDLSSALTDKGNGHYQLDLKDICRQTLEFSGLKKENILVSDICTCCNSDYLHSHRATKGKRGNLCAFITLS